MGENKVVLFDPRISLDDQDIKLMKFRFNLDKIILVIQENLDDLLSLKKFSLEKNKK